MVSREFPLCFRHSKTKLRRADGRGNEVNQGDTCIFYLTCYRPTRNLASSRNNMADDLDIEAMLEAPYRKDDKMGSPDGGEEHSKSRKKRSRSRDRRRSKSRERKRSRSREQKRSKERRRSRSRERRRSRERGGRYRDYNKSQGRKRSKSRSPIRRERSPNRLPTDNLTPEERDARTVFCMQLAARIRPRDLEDFFSAVGKVRDVRMISDRNSRRSKGIAYIEFVEASSVPLAIGLTGQRLLGVPIIVQASQAEKNRAAAAAAAANNLQKGSSGPMRLYIGSLHFNITEEMLRGIFEPFGRIEGIQLMMDTETGRSKGYGFITFADAECAKKALEQLNGFELAGRPMKLGHVTERSDGSSAASFLDNDELDRSGIDLGTTGRLQLMARLAEGTGLQIPPAAQQALQMSGAIAIGAMAAVSAAMNPGLNLNMNPPALSLPSQPLATHCFQLSNMFNPNSEEHPGWEVDIQHDVIEECNKHGGVVHIYVDRKSLEGNVYVKCPSLPAAMAAVSALHGRYFAGKMITAAYVPLPTYHNLFPEAATATQLLAPPPRR
ncbi:RNA-binding protein 39-like isoform X1 [Entelurus aequoreus]|uniref:RNA-binding protein 39-like isoform X1 n=2 Tax=Entelurus aequoreus TaxID=161455 RepID=UPI002B1D82EA|nr:RNA-binding protein 39-like isoform X1 [Entelurus aequoreus]XP_061906247.1 RNA-binding protein 39-like isoform X1 [Entelurus aequoreus]